MEDWGERKGVEKGRKEERKCEEVGEIKGVERR